MRKQGIGVALMCAGFALSSAGPARAAQPQPVKKPDRVVMVVGKNICYGAVPAPTRCDFKLPGPSAAKAKGMTGWLEGIKTRLAAKKSATTK